MSQVTPSRTPSGVTKRSELTEAISAAMVELYAAFYDHDRTTATTYINDNIVVCVLEDILTIGEDALLADGARGEVIDGRVAFQTDTEDEFTRRDPAADPSSRGRVHERQPDHARRRVRAVLPRRPLRSARPGHGRCLRS